MAHRFENWFITIGITTVDVVFETERVVVVEAKRVAVVVEVERMMVVGITAIHSCVEVLCACGTVAGAGECAEDL